MEKLSVYKVLREEVNEMKKSLVAATVSLCLIFSMSVPAVAFASDGGSVYQPQWVNVSDILLTMDYSGGAVNWTSEITGYSGVTSISAAFTLEKKNTDGKYEYVDSWTASSAKTYLYKEASKTATHGTYRLSVSATVKGSSGTETVTNSLVKTI
jgi:hypothetical protein